MRTIGFNKPLYILPFDHRFIGFAVGRTSFWEPLAQWRANQISRQQAVNEIAQRYREFVDIFEENEHAA